MLWKSTLLVASRNTCLLNELQEQDSKIHDLEQQVAKVNVLERELAEMHAALTALQSRDQLMAQR